MIRKPVSEAESLADSAFTIFSFDSNCLGVVFVTVNPDSVVTALTFDDRSSVGARQPSTGLMKDIEYQIRAYLSGALSTIEVPYCVKGTSFQQEVWAELTRVPYGTTASYSQVASRIGCPKAARAVGCACGANQLLILIPCHRVIASRGGLGGFTSGLWRKRLLLQIESGGT